MQLIYDAFASRFQWVSGLVILLMWNQWSHIIARVKQFYAGVNFVYISNWQSQTSADTLVFFYKNNFIITRGSFLLKI